MSGSHTASAPVKRPPKSASPALTLFGVPDLHFQLPFEHLRLDGPSAWQTQYVQKRNRPLSSPCSLLLFMVSTRQAIFGSAVSPPPTVCENLTKSCPFFLARIPPHCAQPWLPLFHPPQRPSSTSHCFSFLDVLQFCVLQCVLTGLLSVLFIPAPLNESILHSTCRILIMLLPCSGCWLSSTCGVRRCSSLSAVWPLLPLRGSSPFSRTRCASKSERSLSPNVFCYFPVIKTALVKFILLEVPTFHLTDFLFKLSSYTTSPINSAMICHNTFPGPPFPFLSSSLELVEFQ